MDEKIYLDPDHTIELDPCVYQVDKILKNCTIEILKCPHCGKVSVGWYLQDDTEEISEEEFYSNR